MDDKWKREFDEFMEGDQWTPKQQAAMLVRRKMDKTYKPPFNHINNTNDKQS